MNPSDTEIAQTVRCMLRFGFPPDFARADTYLRELLLPAVNLAPQGHRPMQEVLEEIVGETIETAGTERIIIPLSAGNDSRALFAAALRCVPKERILCFTWFDRHRRDVLGARKVCETLGVEWKWVDNDRIPWSYDNCLDSLRAAYASLASYRSLFECRASYVDKQLGSGNLWLSGYFGGAISGGHITHFIDEPRLAVDEFLAENATLATEVTFDMQTFTDRLLRFVSTWDQVRSSFRSLTKTDLLDFGFRQGLRIRGEPGVLPNVCSPFEDPRWIRWWLDQEFEARRSQRDYLLALRKAYPDVFMLAHDLVHESKPRQPGLVRRLIKRLRPGRVPSKGIKHQDFLTNKSAHSVHKALLEQFDHRGLIPEVTFAQKLPSYGTFIDTSAYHYILHGTRAEAHLQIETLAGIRAS